MTADGVRPGRRPHVAIIGGGIAGLAAAERLTRDEGVRVTLLEASGRFGGCIATERTDGFVIELGPDVILAAKPAAIELAARLGLTGRLIGTNPAIRGAYIKSRGRLVPLPQGMSGLIPSRMGPMLTTPLLSRLGKLRAALEWFVPRAHPDEMESVEAFVVRRLGRETYERMVEPLLTGVFAGDGSRLSVDATFPRLRAMEVVHGGIIRAMMAERRAPRHAEDRATNVPGIPTTPFLSFTSGLAELPEALVTHLVTRGVELRADAAVASIESRADDPASGGAVTVRLRDGAVVDVDSVVLATPVTKAALLLAGIDAVLSDLLSGIDCTSTATVSLSFKRSQVRRALDASGYTIPRVEGSRVLACTWSSTKFAGRAPPDFVLFRLFFGGVGRESVVEEDDFRLVDLGRHELAEIVGVTGAPLTSRVTRWRHTLPQYAPGHLGRVASIEDRLRGMPWLGLAGSALRGVGVPDCIRSGQDAAERVLKYVSNSTDFVRPIRSGINPDKS